MNSFFASCMAPLLATTRGTLAGRLRSASLRDDGSVAQHVHMELEGRVALVTGAGSGMGRATVRRLVDEGMQVCGLDVNADAVRAVAEEVGALAVTCDVSDAQQVDAAFAP